MIWLVYGCMISMGLSSVIRSNTFNRIYTINYQDHIWNTVRHGSSFKVFFFVRRKMETQYLMSTRNDPDGRLQNENYVDDINRILYDDVVDLLHTCLVKRSSIDMFSSSTLLKERCRLLRSPSSYKQNELLISFVKLHLYVTAADIVTDRQWV